METNEILLKMMGMLEKQGGQIGEVVLRLDKVEQNQVVMQQRLDGMQIQLDAVEEQVGEIKTRLGAVETRLEGVQKDVARINGTVAVLEADVKQLKAVDSWLDLKAKVIDAFDRAEPEQRKVKENLHVVQESLQMHTARKDIHHTHELSAIGR